MASGFEGCDDSSCEVAGVGVFEEGAVWGAFSGGVWPWAIRIFIGLSGTALRFRNKDSEM